MSSPTSRTLNRYRRPSALTITALCVIAGGSVAVASPAAAFAPASPGAPAPAAPAPIAGRPMAPHLAVARAPWRPRGLQTNPFVQHATTATLTADRTSVHSGATVTFAGSVTFSSGVVVRNQPVTLQVQRGSTWDSVATAASSETGAVTFTVRPAATRTYRLSYAGSTALASTTSGAVAIDVADPVVRAVAARTSSLSYSPTMTGTGTGARVIAIAASLAGRPYVYAAAGPNSFDCSGLTMYVFAQVGVALPHNADAQKSYGTAVSAADARPGDIVVFLSNGYGYHVGIYAGNGYMWDAPHSGTTVGLHQVYDTNVVFRRLV